jgi:hypothetical protein
MAGKARATSGLLALLALLTGPYVLASATSAPHIPFHSPAAARGGELPENLCAGADVERLPRATLVAIAREYQRTACRAHPRRSM